jgi:isopentenyl-diphosphate delta-isomerase
MEEYVVLVDEHDHPVGTSPKATVHTAETPLHRGFSVFVFDRHGRLLVTRRSAGKKTFPGVMTNSVCGHPGPEETYETAANRRLSEELGFAGVLTRTAAAYRYRFSDSGGIVENEICPILVALADRDPAPNPEETDLWKWMDWTEFIADIRGPRGSTYSPWCREEAEILVKLGYPAALITP